MKSVAFFVVLFLISLRLPTASLAQSSAVRNETAQPLQFDVIAGRLFAYRGREVILEGKLAAVTQSRNGPILTVQTRSRVYVYLICPQLPPSLKVNDPVSIHARIPVSSSLQYLDFIKFYSGDEERREAEIAEVDLSKVRFDEEGERKMFEMINEERQKVGLRPYRWNEKLQWAARKHSADMALNNYSSHESKDGRTPAKRVANEGIRYSGVGENIAGSASVASAHKGLMDSPGHRSNILSKDFTDIGIGIVKNADGSVTVTQNFIYGY
jgi:uncharacterized protein YkwD